MPFEDELDIPQLTALWAKDSPLLKVLGLKREKRPPIENLVFEGGGVKGLAYGGALNELERTNLLAGVKRVAGSSAGGIVAMMVAVGYEPAEILDIMANEIDLKEMMDRRIEFDPTRFISASGVKLGGTDLYALFKHKALFKGDRFVELSQKIVSRKLKAKIIDAFQNEKVENPELAFQAFLESLYIKELGEITFDQLKKINERFPTMGLKELYLTGTRLSDASFKEFSADKDPNMKIVDALRITMSFPFGFEPVLYQGDYYADGGIADNYPMQIFDQRRFLTHGRNESGVNPCTLGFLIDSKSEIDARWGILPKEMKSLKMKDFIGGVLQGIHNRSEILRKYYQINSIQILDEEIETLNFNLTAEEKTKLILSGQMAMREYANLYLGEDVVYSYLPDYDTVYEKYYSKGPEALVRIMEEELWPLYQEMTTLYKVIKKLTADENEPALIDSEEAYFYKFLKFDIKDRLIQSLQMLDEHMDAVMETLESHQSSYMDPRCSAQRERDLFFQSQSRLQEIRKLYEFEDLLESQKEERAKEHHQIVEDFIQLGLPESEAKDLAVVYLATLNTAQSTSGLLREQKERIALAIKEHMMENIVIDALLNENYEFDDKTIELIKERWRRLKNQYNPYIAKEIIFKEIKNNKIPKENTLPVFNDMVTQQTLDYLYCESLRDITDKLSSGKWGDQLSLQTKDDIQHNLFNMKVVNGETHGKHMSDYSVLTVAKAFEEDTTFLSFKRKVAYPPLKASFLYPSKATLSNVDKPIKEIIVAFDESTHFSNSKFGLISKYSKNRKKYFDYHKAELLKSLQWIILRAKEQGTDPPNATFKVTISGEGLGGQDAQYFLSELLADMYAHPDADEYEDLKHIDLVLTDPSRVKASLAAETALTIKKLKTRTPDLDINGYNLVHRPRKAQSYIGEANILSKVSPKHAHVVLDLRDKNAPLLQREIVSNQGNIKQFQAKINKRSYLYNNAVYQFARRALTSVSKIPSVFINLFPKFAKFLVSLPFKTGYFVLRQFTYPLKNLYRKIKGKPKDKRILTAWSSKMNDIRSETSDERELSLLKLESVSKELVNKGSPGERLKREQRPPVQNLVLEGGGVKGLAYVGALEEMEKKGLLKDVKRVAGSSAGGVMAALFGIGYTTNELMDLFKNKIDYNDFMDEPFSVGGIDTFFKAQGIPVGLTGMISLFKNKGLYKGDAFKAFLSQAMDTKLTQGLKESIFKRLSALQLLSLKNSPEPDKAIDDFLKAKLQVMMQSYNIESFDKITFKQLKELANDFPELNIKELYVTGTNLTDGSLKVFSADSDPDMPIVDAVRITMSFPGGFFPVKYQGHYYVDGGVADNYPMQIFDDAAFLEYGLNDAGANPATLGLLVDSVEEIESRWGIVSDHKPELSLPGKIAAVINGMHNRSELLRDKYNINSIQIPDDGVSAVDFNLNTKQKEKLIENGRHEVRQYHQHYMGKDVEYIHLEEYPSYEQKYFSKSGAELRRILKEEVQPLLDSFNRVKPALLETHKILSARVDKDDSVLDEYLLVNQAIENAKALENEKKVILRALTLKGEPAKVTEILSRQSLRFTESRAQRTSESLRPSRPHSTPNLKKST